MKELATVNPQQTPSLFNSEDKLNLSLKLADSLAKSDIIPPNFQKKPANVLVALELANRLNISPMAVFQSLNIIHGKPSFSATFVIAQINASGKYKGGLRFRVQGSGDNKECIAWAKDLEGEIVEGPPVSIQMAKKEGWFDKAGSKWKTLPDQMLRYRAATFFARLYSPELTLGMQTSEELRDVYQHDSLPQQEASSINAAIVEQPPIEEAEVVEAPPTPAESINDLANMTDKSKVKLVAAGRNATPEKTKPSLRAISEQFDKAQSIKNVEAVEQALRKYDWNEEEYREIEAMEQAAITRLTSL